MQTLTQDADLQKSHNEAEAQKEFYRIHSGRMAHLTERFEKIAKRAKRLGCVAPSFEIVSTETVTEEKTGRIDLFNIVRLVGERPVLAGYRFLGVLDHTSECGLIVRTVPGMTVPVQYRTADPSNCDHCQKRIATRKETFIVENVERGEFKQVGRQCLSDFLGGVDPKHILAVAEWLIECDEFMQADEDESCGYARSSASVFDIVSVLSLTSALCRNIGWTPCSKQTDFGPVPTANLVSTYMVEPDKTKMFRDGKSGYVDYKEMAKFEVMPKDVETAEAAIEWARSLSETGEELNDYLYNINTIAKPGALRIKHFGLGCSIISAYNRTRENAMKTDRDATTLTHFGEVGKREEFTLTVMRHSTTEGQYGVTHIVGFEDASGNRAVWFGSNSDGLETGETVTVKATVKKHDSYQGVPQTILTRVARAK